MNGQSQVHPSVRSAVKRSVDLAVAVAGLLLLMPALGAIALLILAVMGRPVLFRQVRAGYCARPFAIYKFRTMRERAGSPAGFDPVPDAVRLTGLGRFLRRTSLDELPQLWNVIRGEMSLVGPRPQLARHVSACTPEVTRRAEVRPGITGWAQVNGRNAIGWGERFARDSWYVDHWSHRLDAKILLMTVATVIQCDCDAAGEGVAEASSRPPPAPGGDMKPVGAVLTRSCGGPRRPAAWSRRRIAACLILAVNACVLFHEPILIRFAHQVRVTDPPARSDAIIVLLGGYDRPALAAELYGRGLAPVVLLGRMGDVGGMTEAHRQVLEQGGVPDRAIEVLPGGPVANTHDEAVRVREYASSRALRRITIVTTAFHTARAKWIFERELSGSGVVVVVAASDSPLFDESNWFKSAHGAHEYLWEPVKILYYRLVY